MTGVRNNMKAEMDKIGGELEITDSQNRQPLQNDQVDAYIAKGANVVIVNPVDRTAALPLMEKAKAAGIPIVFINREPEAEVMQAYDKIWYDGAKAEESGTQSGELIVDYFKNNPGADKNKDGKIQYIMLRGEQGHQDAVLRTEYSVKAMKDGGFELEELGSDTANWDKVQATDKMKGFISAVGIERIEAVLA
ncbi:MAG: substrate-binding domain-containing protein, partial [Synergistaceae bacterium]|nr:substrate-binding domain-containing protein [Synergistaceae bacterium]